MRDQSVGAGRDGIMGPFLSSWQWRQGYSCRSGDGDGRFNHLEMMVSRSRRCGRGLLMAFFLFFLLCFYQQPPLPCLLCIKSTARGTRFVDPILWVLLPTTHASAFFQGQSYGVFPPLSARRTGLIFLTIWNISSTTTAFPFLVTELFPEPVLLPTLTALFEAFHVD